MSSSQDDFVLRLYIAGQTPKCLRAFTNLKRICEEYLANRYRIEITHFPMHRGEMGLQAVQVRPPRAEFQQLLVDPFIKV